MRLIFKNKKTRLTKRVNKLIEEKSSDFKKKFKLLSVLSETKISDKRFSELECYTNTLIETNGNSPSFVSTKNFVSECLLEGKVKNANRIILQLENYLNLKHKANLKETVVDEELNNILVKNYRLDNKIHDTLLESVSRRKGIFFESAQKTTQTGYGEVVDLDDLLGIVKKVADDDVKAVEASPEAARQQKILGNTKKIAKELDAMHGEVVDIIDRMSNIAKRKVWIVFQIHSYLNVFRSFKPPMDRQQAAAVSKFAELGEYSSMKSGLLPAEIETLQRELDSILARGSKEGDINFEDNTVRESELLTILKKSVGKGPEALEDYNIFVSDLNRDFPLDGSTPDLDKPLRTREEFEAETAEELRGIMSDEEFAAYEAELQRKQDEEDADLEARSTEIDFAEGPFKSAEEKEFFEILIRAEDIETKRDAYNKLIAMSASPEEFEAYIKQYFDATLGDKPMSYADIARVSGGDFSATAGARQEIMKMWFMSTFYSTDDSKKAEIYSALGEKWVEGLRRLDLIEDETVDMEGLPSKKGSKIGQYLEKLEDILSRKQNILAYLDGSLSEDLESDIAMMGNESVAQNPEMEKLQILHTMMTELGSFKVFSSRILSRYYHENIWKSSEADLAQAVKEYFRKYFPEAKIDASNKLAAGKASGVIEKSEGRALFNPIVYWVMGRTGIKDKGGRVSDARNISSERLEYFRKKFPKTLAKYNEGDAAVQLNMSQNDIEDLLDDISSESGLIGKVYYDKKKLDDQQVKDVISWILGLSASETKQAISEALLYSEQFKQFKAQDKLFNKETEKVISAASKKMLKDYESANKPALKQHSEYLSDEFGYAKK